MGMNNRAVALFSKPEICAFVQDVRDIFPDADFAVHKEMDHWVSVFIDELHIVTCGYLASVLNSVRENHSCNEAVGTFANALDDGRALSANFFPSPAAEVELFTKANIAQLVQPQPVCRCGAQLWTPTLTLCGDCRRERDIGIHRQDLDRRIVAAQRVETCHPMAGKAWSNASWDSDP